MTRDQRITRISVEVRLQFKDNFHSLIELQHTIPDYLHQIDTQNKIIKRIRKLKYLKDQLTWEKATSVCRTLTECVHQLLEPVPTYSTPSSLSFLCYTDSGLEAISGVREKISSRKEANTALHIPLNAEELDAGYIVEDFVDTDINADAFFASSQDFYTFVKGYPNERQKTMEQKVEYYTEIIFNHHSRLLITGDWHSDGIIDYPLIYNRQ